MSKKDTRDLGREMDALKQMQSKQMELLTALVERAGGVPPAAAEVTVAATPSAKKPDLREKIESALRREILNAKNLAAAVGEPKVGKVENLVKQLETEGKVCNLMPVDLGPGRYVWRIGESSTQQERVAMIVKLLDNSKYSNGELMRIMDIHNSKLVENALNEVRRHSVVNGGDIDIRSKQIDGHSKLYGIGPLWGEPAPLPRKTRAKTPTKKP